MRHLVVVFVLSMIVHPVSATPDMAAEWGARASTLYQDTETRLIGLRSGKTDILDTDFEDALLRFAVTAERLGHWIDNATNAHDFGCIFRGMAEETDIQLRTLADTGAAPKTHRKALLRLITLFDDAEAIAIAAISAAEGRKAATVPHAEQCRANPATFSTAPLLD